jgi:predicted Zn-dependent protease
MKRRCLISALLSTAILVTPQILPATSKSEQDVNAIGNRRVAHRSIISEEKEIAIGKQYAAQVERTAKLVKDPVVSEYINRIAQNLARNSDLKIPVTAKVIDDPAINAFALPGGFLYINSGVIQAADGEDQIAGVIAHEIAHVAARHWASQMTKQTILRYAMIPLIFTPMSYPVYMGVSEAMNFGIPLAFLKFSRADEAEADYLGIQYMYKAGYDPNAYVAFFGRIMQKERQQPGSVASIFMDHPLTPDRVIKAEEEIKTILPKRNEYLVTTSEFSDIKSRLETVVAELRKGQGSRPTLKRRPSTDAPQNGGNSKSDGDQPPVLRRRD